MCFLTISCKIFCRPFWNSAFGRASSFVEISSKASATIVLRMMFGLAQDCDEPAARNSNLLPVKAKGLVLFLSVTSHGSGGRVSTPILMNFPFLELLGSPASIWSMMSESCSPRNMEIIAGGASFAPRRWSFPAPAVAERRRSACSSTALITAQRVVMNMAFSCGFVPGLRRLRSPTEIDQLLCLPEPLTPANGFSCRRHSKPCFSAVLRRISMIIMLWSMARLSSSNTGAISNCAGATSLWRVFAGIPILHSSLSTSSIKVIMRGCIEPK